MPTHDEALKKALRQRKIERIAKARRNEKQVKASHAARKRDDAIKVRRPKKQKHLGPGLKKKWTEEDPSIAEEAEALAQQMRDKTTAKLNKRRAKLRDTKSVEQVAEEETQREVNQAKRELAQRALCRKYLIASILRFNPNYLAGWVHKDICVRLERFMRDIEAGKNPRLMLQMPPRHGKSTIASQEFPAWVLGHHPEWEIMGCSYAESLALDFSRNVRERLRDPEYQVLFKDTRLDRENSNAQGWKTTKKGGFLPAGVGGAITGKGAHILIIDDPVKNSQEAESETTRESISNWYDSTAYTRLAPGGGVLVIQTRWHLDDLSGRLEYKMREGDGDVFEIVRYPAVATEDEKWRKKGEALHRERYDETQLKMIRKAVGERTWAALYQQNPVPDEGAAFQHSMIQYYTTTPEKHPNLPTLPEELTKVSVWDLAIGQKEVNDRTVGLTWGKDVVGQYWFVDCRRGHFDAMEIVDEICDNYVKHAPNMIGIEKDKVGQAVGSFLDTEIESRELYGLYVEELSPAREGNKLHRCRSLQGLMRRGKVFLPHPDDAPWVYEFVSELMQFPYGRRDDHVDAAAYLALLAAQTPAPGMNYSRVPKRDSWRDRLRKLTRDSKTMMSS